MIKKITLFSLFLLFLLSACGQQGPKEDPYNFAYEYSKVDSITRVEQACQSFLLQIPFKENTDAYRVNSHYDLTANPMKVEQYLSYSINIEPFYAVKFDQDYPDGYAYIPYVGPLDDQKVTKIKAKALKFTQGIKYFKITWSLTSIFGHIHESKATCQPIY